MRYPTSSPPPRLAITDLSAEQLADLLIAKLRSSSDSNSNNSDATAATVQDSIQESRNDLELLDIVTRSLQDLTKQKRRHLLHLHRSLSPLLSLGSDIQARIASYLDEEGLHKFEAASPLVDRTSQNRQWEILDQRRTRRSTTTAITSTTPRGRGIRFAMASEYARRMEAAAKLHYHGDGGNHQHCGQGPDEKWPSKLYNKHDFRSHPPDELFVRISYSGPQNRSDDNKCAVTVEGFFPRKNFLSSCSGSSTFCLFYLNEDDLGEAFVSSSYENGSNNNKSGNIMGVDWNAPMTRDDTERWPLEARQTFARGLSITILADSINSNNTVATTKEEDDDDDDDKFQLVVSTSGMAGNKKGAMLLTPRSPFATETKADPNDCVNVAIRLLRTAGIGLFLEWGSQDTFHL